MDRSDIKWTVIGDAAYGAVVDEALYGVLFHQVKIEALGEVAAAGETWEMTPDPRNTHYWYWVAADNPQVHLELAAGPLTVDMDEAEIIAAVDVAFDAVWYDHLRDVPDLYE